MAEFQKVMEAGNLPSAPATLNTNTGSLATDLTAAAGFGLQLLDRYNQGKAQSEAAQAQMQTKDALSRGEALAKRNAATLMQLEGTQLSLKRREFETQALNKLSGAELEGYLSGAEKFGMGSYLKDAIDSRRKQVDAELDYRRITTEQGKESVAAMAVGADEKSMRLYESFMADGLTEDEYYMIGAANAGREDAARRISAENAAQASTLGLQKTQAELAINEQTNNFMLDKKNTLNVAGLMVTKAFNSGDAEMAIAATNEYKRQLTVAKTEFTNFLQTLPPESMKYMDMQKQIKTFNDTVSQMETIIDNADPTKANERMITLAMQGTLAGWLVEGTAPQQYTAMSLFMGVSPDSDLAQLAVRSQVAGSGAISNPFAEIANNMSKISSGKMDVTDPKFGSTLTLINESKADTVEKVPAVAETLLQDKLPAPNEVNTIIQLRDKFIQDNASIEAFKNYMIQNGDDPWDVLRTHDMRVMRDRVWPDLREFGFKEGSVQFKLENGRVRFDFTPTERDNPDLLQRTRNARQPGALIVQDRDARRRLNKVATLIERMSKSASVMGDIPEQDARQVYIASLNRFLNPTEGQGVLREQN